MNSAPLNGVVFNGAPLDAVQRSATHVDVVAQVTLTPRVWARGLIGTTVTAQASIAATARAFFRAVSVWSAEAKLAYLLRNYTTAPTSWGAQADVSVDGSVQDRTEVNSPVVVNVSVLPTISARVFARSPINLAPTASVVALPSSYTRVSSTEQWSASADIWLQIDVLRRIPYDEDTVDERTIVVPEDQRTVYVS